MTIRQWALAPLALSLSLGLHAQTAAPAKPDAKADPKAEEAAAAMERAKRLAAGPMRVILEASKGKRPPAEAAPVTAASPEGSSLRTVATRSAAPQDITVRSAPAPPATLVETPAAAPAPAVVAPAPAPAPSPTPTPTPAATTVSTQITLSSETLQSRSVAAVPGLERATPAAAQAMPAVPAAPAALPKVADTLIKPKLVRRVDPELSQRLLDDMGRNAVVAVDLTIRADGSVGGVNLVTTVPTRVQRVVVGALEQWLFEPLASDRVHRIELVFNGE